MSFICFPDSNPIAATELHVPPSCLRPIGLKGWISDRPQNLHGKSISSASSPLCPCLKPEDGSMIGSFRYHSGPAYFPSYKLQLLHIGPPSAFNTGNLRLPGWKLIARGGQAIEGRESP